MAQAPPVVVLPLYSHGGAAKRQRIVCPLRDAEAGDETGAKIQSSAFVADLWRLLVHSIPRLDDVARLAATCRHARHAIRTGPRAPPEIVYALDWLSQYGLVWLQSTRLVLHHREVPYSVRRHIQRLPQLQKSDGTECGRHAVVTWRLYWLLDIVRHRNGRLLEWLARHWESVGGQEVAHYLLPGAAADGWSDGVATLFTTSRTRLLHRGCFDLAKEMKSHPMFPWRCPTGHGLVLHGIEWASHGIEWASHHAMLTAALFGHREVLETMLDALLPEFVVFASERILQCIAFALLGPGSVETRSALVEWLVDYAYARHVEQHCQAGSDAPEPVPPMRLPCQIINVYGVHPTTSHASPPEECWPRILALATGTRCADAILRVLARKLDPEIERRGVAQIALDAIAFIGWISAYGSPCPPSKETMRDRVGLSSPLASYFREHRNTLCNSSDIEALVAIATAHGARSEQICAALMHVLTSRCFPRQYVAALCRVLLRYHPDGVAHWAAAYRRFLPRFCSGPGQSCMCDSWTHGARGVTGLFADYLMPLPDAIRGIDECIAALDLPQWHQRHTEVHPERILQSLLLSVQSDLEARRAQTARMALPPPHQRSTWKHLDDALSRFVTFLRVANEKGTMEGHPLRDWHVIFALGTVVRVVTTDPEFGDYAQDHDWAPHRYADVKASHAAAADAKVLWREQDAWSRDRSRCGEEAGRALRQAYALLAGDGYPYPGGEGADRMAVPCEEEADNAGERLFLVFWPARSASLTNLSIMENERDAAGLGGESRRLDCMGPRVVALIAPDLTVTRV